MTLGFGCRAESEGGRTRTMHDSTSQSPPSASHHARAKAHHGYGGARLDATGGGTRQPAASERFSESRETRRNLTRRQLPGCVRSIRDFLSKKQRPPNGRTGVPKQRVISGTVCYELTYDTWRHLRAAAPNARRVTRTVQIIAQSYFSYRCTSNGCDMRGVTRRIARCFGMSRFSASNKYSWRCRPTVTQRRRARVCSAR